MARPKEKPGITLDDLNEQGLEWLLESSFLGQLDATDLDEVLSALAWRDYEPGDVLIEEGGGPRGVDLVVAGQATVMVSGSETVARVGPGHLVGERSILLGEPTSARVVAASPMHTLHVGPAQFQALLARSEPLRRYVGDLVALRERSGLMMDLLRQNPILRSLGRDDLEWLLQSGTLLRYEPGEIVVRAGERSTDVFLVVRGKVAVYAPAPDGGARERLAVYEAGALVGHVAMLLDVPRTADVVTAKRCELLKIRARAFMEIINRNALVQRQLYQHVAGMDLYTDRARAVGTGVIVVTVWSARRGIGATTLAYGVAAALRDSGPVTVVDLAGPRTAQALGLATRDEMLGGVEVGWLAAPPGWNLDVVWPTGTRDIPALLAALRVRQGDDGYVVIASPGTDPPDSPTRAATQVTISVRRSRDASSRMSPERRGFWIDAVRLEEGVELPMATTRNAVRIADDVVAPRRFWRRADLGALLDPGTATGRACARLVRVLQGRTVGVALGGGGALGFAHLGLLRALHEARVPIDYVAGVSFGSVVGALYATGGMPLLEQLVAQRRLFQAYAGMALLSLAPLAAWIDDVTGGRTLGATEVPFFPVALDLWTGREFVLTRGTVADGMRASSSFPGIFPPFRRGVHHLVDGGIVNNVPASVVWDAGAAFIIASNVIPSVPVGRGPALGAGPWGRFKAETVGRFDDLVRSMFILMSQTGRDRATLADYVFDLELEGFNIYDFHRGDVIYEAGLRQARGEMQEILYAREHDRSIRVPSRAPLPTPVKTRA